MSRGFYTPCNVFTRRQSSDVFHNDPFKVQSYNFHYAERPAYAVQHYPRPPPPKKQEPLPFKTFYYNPKFHRNQESLGTAPPTSSFVKTRRRQFLQDFNRVSTPARTEIGTGFRSTEKQRTGLQPRHPVTRISPAVTTNPPLLRTCCNRENYKTMTMRRGQSVSAINTSLSRTESRNTFNFMQPERNQSQSTVKLTPRRSASSCSGCAININIRGIDSELDMDKRSFRIKIETDACLHNNTDKQTNHGQEPKARTMRCRSSETFEIDKRLSKFSMSEVRTQDALLAKRLQTIQLERERLEKMRQQELQKEQERKENRERVRQLERQREHERLLKLEAERERQKLRELELERKREVERRYQDRLRQERQQRMPMRAMSMPESIGSPVVTMSSHLYRPASTDRLPGMVPCYVRPSTVNSRSERLQKCTQNLTSLQCPKPKSSQEQHEANLERRSSNTSNYNARVPESGGINIAMRQLSATRINDEPKLLNLHVNGVPVSSHLPIHARINNMPIRITTSQPVDEHLQFSMNRVRVARAQPMAGQERRRSNRSHSRSGTGLQESPTMSPCNVSINVYSDNPRTMRL